jgi:hypothetical protein
LPPSQDVQEGKFSLIVDKRKGVDFKFTSQQLTLNIGELSERVIKPAMVQLANQIDRDVHALYKDVWNWVGTPGLSIDAFAGLREGPGTARPRRRAAGRPLGGSLPDRRVRHARLADCALHAGRGKDAYRAASLGRIAKIDTYSSQNVQTHTLGTRDNTTPVVTRTQSTTWASTKDTGTMTLNVSGHDTVVTIKQGDVFTIANVFAVNPVTKVTLPLSAAVRRQGGCDCGHDHRHHDTDDLASDHHVGRVPDRRAAANGGNHDLRRAPLPPATRRTSCSTRTRSRWSWSDWSPAGRGRPVPSFVQGLLRSRHPLLRRHQRHQQLAPRCPVRRQDDRCAPRHPLERHKENSSWQ